MNKQQKNYIKAVVGFVLAAIILCAGIMTALYLMREEKGMENLMAPVLKRLIAGILLFGLTVCWRHFFKKSVSKVAGIIVIVLLSLFFAWHISGIPQEKALKPQNVNLEKAEFRGYEINGNHFLIKEARPFIKYKMQSSKIANVKVYFEEPVAQDTDVKISYQTKEKPTYEQNPRVWANIKKGEKIAFGEVDATGITRIKVRFGSKIGQQFVLDHIELNANYRERVQKKQITMIIYFMMFLLMPACYLLLSHAVELQKRTNQNKILKVLSFPFGLLVPIALFITLLACSMVAWLKSTCGDVSFSIIVLQLTSPIKGTDSGVINSIIKTGIIPPLLVTLTISIVYLIMVRVLYNLEDLPVKKVPAWTKICLEIILLIVLVGTIQIQGTKVGMWEYIKSVQEKTDFYEKYYVNPAKTKLDFPSQKRNLIYIFMESMESSYADQEDGGIMDDNYIPNLTKLAKENINFSDKADGKLGGPTCLEATAYTVGGMVAQTAAINLKLHNSGSMFGNFLPNLTTMGDILNKEGYQQVFLCGSEGDFAGRDTYFTSHKDFHIEDYNAAKKEGFIAPDYKVFWGHEDEILYKRAKKQLEQLSSSDKPFNLTMLTVDTHFPRGYKCRLCKDKYNRQYANVIACADQQVYDFVEWIKKQDFYKNTTIVIAGDHTTMVDTSDPIWSNLNNNYKRTVYNTIINADCTYKENVTENRDFSTMDMFPTTLAALGVQIDGNRLGLGTNLFSGQKTLPEKLGRGYINQELKKNDKEYNGFY